MCRTAAFLERWIPWRALRDRLVGCHLKRCPECLREAEDWPPYLRRSFLDQQAEAAAEPSLWPEVGRRIEAWEARRRHRTGGGTRRRLAWTGAAAVALAAAAWVALRMAQPGPEPGWQTSARAGLHYAKLDGEEARAHIFQTPHLTFIMLTKSGQAKEKDRVKN